MTPALVFEVAHQMALVPLAWLVLLHARGQRRDPGWWWIAAAFGVSWLADTAAHFVDPWVISIAFPVSQTAIVGAVLLLHRRDKVILLLTLVAVGMVAVALQGVHGPDVLLSTVASGAAAGIAWQRREIGRLAVALIVAFGATAIAWLGYAIAPGWPTYLVYHVARAVGIALFCWAALRPGPSLRIA